MRSKRGLLPFFVLTLFLAGVLETEGKSTSKPLLVSTTRQGSLKLKPHFTVIRQRPVVVDLSQLQRRDNRLRLPLFGGAEVVLIRDERESGPTDVSVWEGEVEGQPGSMAILATEKNVLVGDVMTRDRKGAFGFYQIRYLGNGVHVLREVDQSKFAAEGPADESELPAPTQDPTSNLCGDPASRIDTLVVYTDAARNAVGGKDAMVALIKTAVRSTNRSYSKSEVTQRLRLVHVQRVEYRDTEIESSQTDRERLVDFSDDHLDGVPALRNAHSADVVVLIVDVRNDCGWSKVMPTVSPSNQSEAYAVVPHDCAGAPRWSFAHELGHIMGARHERGDDDTEGEPFAFNHGFVETSPATGSPFRTIMAKDKSATRIPRWSNPDVRYPDASGNPTGTRDTDNHRALQETALTVANFRCASQ